MGAYEDWLEGNLEVSEIPVTNIEEQAQIEQETNPVNPGPLSNFYRTVFGGLRDSAQAKLNTIEDIAEIGDRDVLAPGINNPITQMQLVNAVNKRLYGEDGLPEIPEPTYFGGSFARDIIQFLPDFIGFDKAIRGTQIATTQGPAFLRGLYNRLMVPGYKTDKVGAVKDIADRAVSDVVRYGTIGSIAEQTSFDPEEERLSNLLYDTFGPDVFVVGPVAEYLKADPDDSVAQSRFKMAIEGAGLGSLLSPIVGFLGRAFDIRSVKQQEAKIADKIKKEQIFEEEFVGPRLPEEPPTSQSEKIINEKKLDTPVYREDGSLDVDVSDTNKYLEKEVYGPDDVEFNKFLDTRDYSKKFKNLFERYARLFRSDIDPAFKFEDPTLNKQFLADEITKIKIRANRDFQKFKAKKLPDSPTTNRLQEPDYPKVTTAKEILRQIKPFTYAQLKMGEIGESLGLTDKNGKPSLAYIKKKDYDTRYETENQKFQREEREESAVLDSQFWADLAEEFDRRGYELSGLYRDEGVPFDAFDSSGKENAQELLTRLIAEDAPSPKDDLKLLEYEQLLEGIDQERRLINDLGFDPDELTDAQLDEVIDNFVKNTTERFEPDDPIVTALKTLVPANLRGDKGLSLGEGPDVPPGPPPPPRSDDGPPPDFDPGDPKKVVNINLEKYDFSKGDIQALTRQAIKNGDWIKARNQMQFGPDGKLLREDALTTGLTIDKFINAPKNIKFTPQELMAARMMLQYLAKQVKELGDELTILFDAGETPSNKQLYNFQLLEMDLGAVGERLVGETSYAGQLLNSFKYDVDNLTPKQAREFVDDIVNQREIADRGMRSIEARIRNAAKLETPEQIAINAQSAVRPPTILDMAQEFWINALLSGIPTQAVNFGSNAIVAGFRPVEAYAQAAISAGRRKDPDRRLSFSEANGTAFATIYGLRDALKTAGKVLYNPDLVKDPNTKLELARQKSINTKLKVFGYDIIGDTIRLPGRGLLAGDVFFKQLAYNQNVYGKAFDIAGKEGIKDPIKFMKRVNSLVMDHRKNPTAGVLGKDFEEIALERGRYQTFTNNLGPTGRSFQRQLNGPLKALKFVVPFVRTPVNIVKYYLERSPAGVVNAFRKQGAERDAAIARTLLGTGLAYLAYDLASEGKIVGGGPIDRQERRLWLQDRSNVPYSFKTSDGKSYEFFRFEPTAMIFGIAADVQQIMDEIYRNPEFYGEDGKLLQDKLGTLLFDMVIGLTNSLQRNLTDKTFFRGITDLVSAIDSETPTGIETYVNNFLGSFVPTMFRNINDVNDPYLRDSRQALDKIMDDLPFFSNKGMPIRRNIFGEKMLRRKQGVQVFSPVTVGSAEPDPILTAFADANYFPGKMNRKLDGIELNEKQYEYMLDRLDLMNARSEFEALITTFSTNDPPRFRREAFEQLMGELRKNARQMTLDAIMYDENSPVYSPSWRKEWEKEQRSTD
tara:strand:- start:1157 stop:5518 length:4362 start_codon:yes stop_codon:yes gene_type:complete